MARNTSITLGRHFEKFIKQQVTGGRYATASEVVRAGLRLLSDEEARLATLRVALEEGETSGFVADFSLERVLEKVKARRR